MPRPNTARLPGGRYLIADLDPDHADSPLRRALRTAALHHTGDPEAGQKPGEGQPGQTPDRAPR